jgi:hypothetical protein
MLGRLPTSIKINGKNYDINTDFRDILCIIAAFNDDELDDKEKIYICLKRLYKDFDAMPPDDYTEAYTAALSFIECEQPHEHKASPRVVNWEKDEQLLFPAINKVAGCEVRLLQYLHWFTFMGFFQGIDREDTYGYILMLRQKKARGKKFEKHEQEFWNNNKQACSLTVGAGTALSADAQAKAIFEALRKEGNNG